MLAVKVENKSNEINFKRGDLVEYPDGLVIIVTQNDSESDTLEGVVLKPGKNPEHLLGRYLASWARSKSSYSYRPIKKFNGKLIMEQYDDDDEDES